MHRRTRLPHAHAGIYDCEAEEAEGLSLFSHLLCSRLRAALADYGSASGAAGAGGDDESDLGSGAPEGFERAPAVPMSLGSRALVSDGDGAGAAPPVSALFERSASGSERPRVSTWDNTRVCLSDILAEKLADDMRRFSAQCFLQAKCGLGGVALDEVAVLLEQLKLSIDDIKVISDKADMGELGVTKHKQADALFRGGVNGRADAHSTCTKLRVYARSTLRRKLVLSGPALAWSRRHLGPACGAFDEGDVMWKLGQSGGSNTAMCSLESEMRGILRYGAVMAGGGKHAWDVTIQRLRSAQGAERDNTGSIRLGVVQSDAIRYGQYSILSGTCAGGTTTTVTLDEGAADEDGVYEGLHLVLTSGVSAGQTSRIYGYTGEDRTLDVLLEAAPKAGATNFVITRLTGFEIGDDPYSWALASSATGRAAAMHGDVADFSSKAFRFQGAPCQVNRVTASGFEQAETYPRNLGNSVREGDVVTFWLDLENESMAFSVNGQRLGEGLTGVTGPVVPAASVPASTECTLRLSNYRRWAPESGWASAVAEKSALSEDELVELKRAFRQYDREGKGEIKIKQMRGLLSDLGVRMTDTEMNDYLDEVCVYVSVCE